MALLLWHWRTSGFTFLITTWMGLALNWPFVQWDETHMQKGYQCHIKQEKEGQNVNTSPSTQQVSTTYGFLFTLCLFCIMNKEAWGRSYFYLIYFCKICCNFWGHLFLARPSPVYSCLLHKAHLCRDPLKASDMFSVMREQGILGSFMSHWLNSCHDLGTWK